MEQLKFIARDSLHRAHLMLSTFRGIPLLFVLNPPKVVASNSPFEPVQTLTPDQAASVDQVSGTLDFNSWVNRGMTIRKGDNVYQCYANLTAALDLVGQLNAAEYNGAAGALSLLPTAGALLGAPTREMWIVYKLVPMAGIFSMFLSLGGSITPSNVGEYDPAEPFSYGGFMPTSGVMASQRRQSTRQPGAGGISTTTGSDAGSTRGQENEDDSLVELSPEKQFAQQVWQRANQDSGGGVFGPIALAMILQFVLVVCLLIPMWYAQRGAVVTWWCRVWGWMYFWYFLVSAVSIFDNLVAAPFTKSYTIRVSRRPNGILLDESVRKITDRSQYPNALEALQANPNTNQHLRMSIDQGSSYSRTCFYVIISVKGISQIHAAAQVVSKASSVAVYAFGTALFASATLLSISIALMVLCILLTAGVAGRVIAMWIVAQVSRDNKPIMHKLVNTEDEAGAFVHAIAELDLLLETKGHVILSGWCVKSRSIYRSLSTYIGLLAQPYDVIAMAEKSTRGSVQNPSGLELGMTGSTPCYPMSSLATPSANLTSYFPGRRSKFGSPELREVSPHQGSSGQGTEPLYSPLPSDQQISRKPLSR